MLKKIRIVKGHDCFVLLAALLLGAPILFWNVVRDGVPIGYAGMFSLMAEQIAVANFKLPFEVPYYGPGGIPFAYPPFGLYLLAIFIKITGKVFIFLRFLPPFLSLLSLVPLYYLTLDFTRSKFAGFVAVLLAATSAELYALHAWAAGIVRAPAFLFSLACLLYFHRFMVENKTKDAVLAGVFLGLAVLSHLSYGLFLIIWIVLWNFIHPRFNRLVASLKMALLGVLIVFPWLWIIISRYEVMVFGNAFNSHGNEQLLLVFDNLPNWPVQIWQILQTMFSGKILALIVGLGIIVQILRKDIWLPLMFFLYLVLFSDGSRFSIIIGCMLAGIGFKQLFVFLHRLLARFNFPFIIKLAGIPVILLLLSLWLDGLDRIDNYSPVLFSEGLEAGVFFQKNSSSESVYLALIAQNEAEWMPYLFRRTPLLSQWGSEWLGAYNQQTAWSLDVRECHKRQDMTCLNKFLRNIDQYPDYLVTLQKDKNLNYQIGLDGWLLVHQNARYLIWYKEHHN